MSSEPPQGEKKRPWESEDAAFALLLRVAAGAAILIALVLLVRLIF